MSLDKIWVSYALDVRISQHFCLFSVKEAVSVVPKSEAFFLKEDATVCLVAY